MKLEKREDDIKVRKDENGNIELVLTGEIKFAREQGFDTYTFESMEISEELAEQVGEQLIDSVE